MPVTEAIQTTRRQLSSDAEAPTCGKTAELPKTASSIPLIALLGFASLGVAFS